MEEHRGRDTEEQGGRGTKCMEKEIQGAWREVQRAVRDRYRIKHRGRGT